ncbi:MAG: hypothetical protein L3J39_15790 [Verrucomicrobiales bacterium]|nr:hypothetical protein [Verrucomicrobiales bacterium]
MTQNPENKSNLLSSTQLESLAITPYITSQEETKPHMPTPELSPEAVRAVTCERLKLLSYGFYLKGAMCALVASIFILHFFVLLAVSFIPEQDWQNTSAPVTSSETTKSDHANKLAAPYSKQKNSSSDRQNSHRNSAPPKIIFRIFAAVIGLIILLGWILGGLTIYAGRCIQNRRRRTFVYVIAGLHTLSFPYGTALGVFAIITLSQADTQKEYPA